MYQAYDAHERYCIAQITCTRNEELDPHVERACRELLVQGAGDADVELDALHLHRRVAGVMDTFQVLQVRGGSGAVRPDVAGDQGGAAEEGTELGRGHGCGRFLRCQIICRSDLTAVCLVRPLTLTTARFRFIIH